MEPVRVPSQQPSGIRKEIVAGWRDVRWTFYFAACLLPLIAVVVLVASLVEGGVSVPPSAFTWTLVGLAIAISLVWAGWRDGPDGRLGTKFLSAIAPSADRLLWQAYLAEHQEKGRKLSAELDRLDSELHLILRSMRSVRAVSPLELSNIRVVLESVSETDEPRPTRAIEIKVGDVVEVGPGIEGSPGGRWIAYIRRDTEREGERSFVISRPDGSEVRVIELPELELPARTLK